MKKAGNFDKVKNVNIAYIGGGSLNWAHNFMNDLACDGVIEGTVRLYDIDVQAAKRNEKYGTLVSKHPKAKSKWIYKNVPNLKEALAGSDFVIISILPGTFTEMEKDVHLPEKYGILQPVGDTAGPGGLMRAIRCISAYRIFAEAIKKHAPDAWVINYTNPMAICVRTLYSVFPGIKAFGCCHEVFGTQKLLARVAEEHLGIKDIPRNEIITNVLGLNHFTWIDKANYKTLDLFPVYKSFAQKYYKSGYEGLAPWKESVFNSANRVKFELFLKYGIMGAAGDRHLVEFMPKGFLDSRKQVESWKFHMTTVKERIERNRKKLDSVTAVLEGKTKLKVVPSPEEGVRQMKALLGLEEFVTNVNLPNYGQISGIPLQTVVETNAVFRKDQVAPVFSGRLPVRVEALMAPHVANQKMIVEAGLAKDKILAFKAFVNDPIVTCSQADARKLFDEMLSGIAAYRK